MAKHEVTPFVDEHDTTLLSIDIFSILENILWSKFQTFLTRISMATLIEVRHDQIY